MSCLSSMGTNLSRKDSKIPLIPSRYAFHTKVRQENPLYSIFINAG
jgi:hypothetical protein